MVQKGESTFTFFIIFLFLWHFPENENELEIGLNERDRFQNVDFYAGHSPDTKFSVQKMAEDEQHLFGHDAIDDLDSSQSDSLDAVGPTACPVSNKSSRW